MKDLNPNRQLNNIIKSMNIIKRIVTSGDILCPTGAENVQQSRKDTPSDLFSDFGLSSAPEMSLKESFDDLEEKQQSNVRLSMPHLPRRPLRYHTRASRVPTSRPAVERGESVLTISDSKSSLFAKEESQEASVPSDDHSSVSLPTNDQVSSKLPDKTVSESSIFSKERSPEAGVLSEDNSSISASASDLTCSKSRGKSVFKNKLTTNTDITSNTVDKKAKEHSDNHQSTMLPPAHTKVSSKGLGHSSISDSTPTVDVDLTGATLDIADVEQKLRQAAQLATSLRTVMKCEAVSPVPEEMRSSGGLEESYVSNISFFGAVVS